MAFTSDLYWVFFHKHSRFTGQKMKGGSISLTPDYHFHPLHRHLDVSRAVTAESLPLHIASSQAHTENLVYTYIILIYILIYKVIYIYIYICIYIYILHIYMYIYIYHIYIYIYIYIYKLWVLSITYTVKKKENALIIHSAMETWKYTVIRNFIIL